MWIRQVGRLWPTAGSRFIPKHPDTFLAELTALLTSPLRIPKPQQIQWLGEVRSDAAIETVSIDPALELAAWNLWRGRPDKDWTLVDCASFIVMQQRGLTQALSTDHHFEQAGFVRLLK